MIKREELFLIGWHIHSPAEHTVQGRRSRSELHLVHVNSRGIPQAVVGVFVTPGQTASKFIASFPKRFFGVKESNMGLRAELNFAQAMSEVSKSEEFWTYSGSLTSPPCSEGIKWFVARDVLSVSTEQMQQLLGVSAYSARDTQQVRCYLFLQTDHIITLAGLEA